MSNSDGALGGLMKAFRSVARADAKIDQNVDRQEGRDRDLGVYNVPEDDLANRAIDVRQHPSPLDDDDDFDPDAETEVADYPLDFASDAALPWDDEPMLAANRPSGVRVGTIRHRNGPPKPDIGHVDDGEILALDDAWDDDDWDEF